MCDRLSKERCSWNMSRVRNKDTKPEKAVRSLLHCMGYRFRLHAKNLPGRPDNLWWDCLGGSAVAGAMLGATIPGVTTAVARRAQAVPLSQMWGRR